MRLRQIVMAVALAFCLRPLISIGQVPEQTGVPTPPASEPDVTSLAQRNAEAHRSSFFQDLDLLRRNDFENASKATISVRVLDRHGNRILGLTESDFALTVNGKPHSAHLLTGRKRGVPLDLPRVLLVFPPNQPEIHYLAIKQCLGYFSSGKEENMPWTVGIFDSNATFTPFTNLKSELLADLERVRTAKEPIQVSIPSIAQQNTPWQGAWITKANAAISEMQRQPGPRLILAMNPLAPTYQGASLGFRNGPYETDGPADLVPIAQQIGAQIYIANVGGPDPIVPGGDAASEASLAGTKPSGNFRVSPAQIRALNLSAAQTSLMMQAAADTLGGFSNSITELAAQMQLDLDSAYTLEFGMTPEDQDRGVPEVAVQINQKGLRAALLDLEPVLTLSDEAQNESSRKTAHEVLASMLRPVSSPDFAITQHVDFFPGRHDFEAVLPMTCLVQWTGSGKRPAEISIVESVVDKDLGTTILERKMESPWEASSVFWERDGNLRHGNYIWRVAISDRQGQILASAQHDFSIAAPRGVPVAISSVVLGKECPALPVVPALMHRATPGNKMPNVLNLKSDPLQLASCRVKPEPTDSYSSTDTLHALIRIYPTDKEEKNKPESWTATFTLRSPTGQIQSQQQTSFLIDSQPGLLASATMPLAGPSVNRGLHSLDVLLQGPGLHKPVTESRTIVIHE